MAWGDLTVLAVVPARSGSRGIPHKNMLQLGGQTLIALAGRTLAALPWIDVKVISTDSPDYAAEGERAGLLAPWLRPASISHDSATAAETLEHALLESERVYERRFDIVLLIEPSSPLRRADDIALATQALVESGADSAVTVSAIDSKSHPLKVFRVEQDQLRFYDPRGEAITSRQQLDPLYSRNGLCYAVTRRHLLERHAILSANTRAVVTRRPVVNIDGPLDVLLAELLMKTSGSDE